MKLGANQGRLFVDMEGDWRQFVATLPPAAQVIGVVSHGELTEPGALVRLTNGTYVQINGETTYQLDGRRVVATMGIAGRRRVMRDGRNVNTYLDAETISLATRIGDGNVSQGIRRALQECHKAVLASTAAIS